MGHAQVILLRLLVHFVVPVKITCVTGRVANSGIALQNHSTVSGLLAPRTSCKLHSKVHEGLIFIFHTGSLLNNRSGYLS